MAIESEEQFYTGLKDKNGVEIVKGHLVLHNQNTYVVKWSINQKVLLLRILNDTGMNWRSLEWLTRVSKYCEVIGITNENTTA